MATIARSSERFMLESNEPPPVLLLEGDEFCLSKDGIARTFYELQKQPSFQSFCIEEFYDLGKALKTFVIRSKTGTSRERTHHATEARSHNMVSMGTPISLLDLKEIDGNGFASAGTGGTTWESSIAMSLFFSTQPHLLQGSVIELGSGVGLGGILSSTLAKRDLTMTDNNQEVLYQCRRNCQRVKVELRVKELDWYSLVESSAPPETTYDTVVVSDCAYRYPDVMALATTVAKLLRKSGKAHLFGPSNRGALHQLVCRLKDLDMDVKCDTIDMQRYRLKPSSRLPCPSLPLGQLETECNVASTSSVQFIHVVATHCDPTSKKRVAAKISEID